MVGYIVDRTIFANEGAFEGTSLAASWPEDSLGGLYASVSRESVMGLEAFLMMDPAGSPYLVLLL